MNAGADALVFANGVLTAEPLLSETLAAAARATIIAADGGARLARHCGLRVDVLIGDMDSIDAGELELLRASGAQVLRHPADKDETDLELALKWAAARAYRRLRVFGAFGNRLDQTLANVQLLALEELRDCDLQMLDGRQRVPPAAPRRARDLRRGRRHDFAAAAAGSGQGRCQRRTALGTEGRNPGARPGARRQQPPDRGARPSAPARGPARAGAHAGSGVNDIVVRKLDHEGREVFRYEGRVLRRGERYVCLRAVFRFDEVDLGCVTFKRGDVFTEWFYSDRWYNVFRIEDGASGALKGWYCNITRPALHRRRGRQRRRPGAGPLRRPRRGHRIAG